IFCRVDGQQKQHVILKAAAARRTLDDLPRDISNRVKTWKIALPADRSPGGFEPTLGKGSLQKFDDRAFDSHIGIPPIFRRSPVTGPVVADAVTAGKSDSAIDHHNASMAAIIVPKKFPGEEDSGRFPSTKVFYLAAAVFHRVDDIGRCAA